MQEERVTRPLELFQEAWMLLSNLTYLRRRLPDPQMPDAPKVVSGLDSRKE